MASLRIRCRIRNPPNSVFIVLTPFPSMLLRASDERVRRQRMLDLLRLQRWWQLQGQQCLHHVVAVRRRRALAAGALGHFAAVEEVVALQDERLDHRLVQLCGRQRILVLEVGPHQCRPEADGQVIGRHQRHLTVLADPADKMVGKPLSITGNWSLHGNGGVNHLHCNNGVNSLQSNNEEIIILFTKQSNSKYIHFHSVEPKTKHFIECLTCF